MKRIVNVFLLSFIWSSYSSAEGFRPYLSIESYAYSNTLPYKELVSDWSSFYEGGTETLQHNWLEVGVQINDWGVAAVWQDFAEVRYSKDLADFYYLTTNKQPVPLDQQYNYYLDVKYLSVDGVRLFNQVFSNNKLSVSAGVSLLNGRQLLDGSVTGGVKVLSNKDYEYDDVYIDYFYSEDRLFDRSVDAPDGNGYSIDLVIQWQPTDNTELSLQLRNIHSFMRWHQSPYTYARITSDNKEYDEQGYVTVKPTLSGRHSEKDFNQRLPGVVDLFLRQGLTKNYHGLIDIKKTEMQGFQSIGLEYSGSDKFRYSVSYVANLKALKFKYETPWFYLGLGSDSTEIGRAKYLSAEIGLSYGFDY